MTIELAIYLMDVLHRLDIAVVLAFALSLGCCIWSGVVALMGGDEDDRQRAEGVFKKAIIVALTCLLPIIIIPSKETIEKIFAIRIAKSEVVTEAAGKVIKLIGKYLPGEAND